MAVELECPGGFDEGLWERHKEQECKDFNLLWISGQLTHHSVEEVGRCLCLSDDDIKKCNRGDSGTDGKSKYHCLLVQWLEKNGKAVWGPLIACLSNLNDQTLLDNISKHFLQETCIVVQEVQQETCAMSLLPYLEPSANFEGPNGSLAELDAAIKKRSEDLYSQLIAGVSTSCSNDRQVSRTVRQNLKNIQRKFASLLVKAFVACAQKPVPVGELQLWLTQRCADKQSTIPLFQGSMLEIINHTSVEQIFMLMSRIGAWNFLNFYLLEELSSEFELHSLEQPIAAFTQEVEHFKKETTLVDFLSVWDGRSGADSIPDCKPVIVKLKEKWPQFTLTDVSSKEGFLASEFHLNPIFRLANGDAGSVYIMWLVPVAAASYMQKVMESEKRPDFVSTGIRELVIGKKTYKTGCSMPTYEDLYSLSISDSNLFWEHIAKRYLNWMKPFERVYDCQPEEGIIKWFTGGTLNVSVNYLDRHVSTAPEKPAIIWQCDDESSETITYRQLLEMTCRVANVLKERGVKKRDRVLIYMPAMPLAIASMLACARIGAVHCVVFSAFNAEALRQKIDETKPKVVVTANQRVVGGENLPLKENVDVALDGLVTSSVKTVLVATRTSTKTELLDRDVCLEEAMELHSVECKPEELDSEDELFIVYTSGTGKDKPRAIMHTQAGYLLYAAVTHKFMFNCQPGDVFGCMADLGWMAGHTSVVYGPLCNGETTVLFEGAPNLPDQGRYWRMIEQHRITHFYTIPSVLKLLSRERKFVEQSDLSSLKVIAVAGEPIPPNFEAWYYEDVGKGKCLFLDTYGQTELGGIAIVRWRAPKDKCPTYFPSSQSFCLFGVDPCTRADSPCEFEELCLKRPTPGMARSADGSVEKLKNYYYVDHGLFRTCDYVSRKDPGSNELSVIGRVDNTVRMKGGCWVVTDLEDQVAKGMKDCRVLEVLLLPYGKRDHHDSLCGVVHTEEDLTQEEKKSVVSDVQKVLSGEDKPVPSNFMFTPRIPKTLSGKRAHHPLQELAQQKFSRTSTHQYQGVSYTFEDVTSKELQKVTCDLGLQSLISV